MQNLFNNVKTAGLKVAEMVTPVLKESKFLESGTYKINKLVMLKDLCSIETFHIPDEECKCKFCKDYCSHFHERYCPEMT